MSYEIPEDVIIYLFSTNNGIFFLGAMLDRNFAL